jgi:hypothetical protein
MASIERGDVVLRLSTEEAWALYLTLSLHSTTSSLKTYSVFAALDDHFDGELSPKQAVALSKKTTLENGLLKVNLDD